MKPIRTKKSRKAKKLRAVLLPNFANLSLIAGFNYIAESGGCAVDSLANEQIAKQSALYCQLTNREKEVLICMAYREQKEICERLHLTVETLHVHRRHLYRKMQFKTKADLIRWYSIYFYLI